MEKIKWTFNRWLSMEHPQEDVYRVKQFLQTKILDTFSNIKPFKTFVWSYDKAYYQAECLKEHLLPVGSSYKRFKFYDVTIENITHVSEWRKDFKHNITSPINNTCYINTQSFNKVGDIRYVSTLSRLHHFPMLLCAGLSNREDDVVKIVKDQFIAWSNQNPFLKSVNWKSGIEVSIRAINLLYARRLLSFYLQDEVEELATLIDESLQYHFYFLPKHLSLYSSSNNHLLFELLGIFLIACNYEFEGCDFWKKWSFDKMIEEMHKQVYSDGFSKEQSSHYHAEVMNIYSMFIAETKRTGMSLPKDVIVLFENMAEALFYLESDKDELMSIGDNDEGQILYPYFDKDFSLKNSLLRDTYALTGRTCYFDSNTALSFDLRNYLVWGKVVSLKPPFVQSAHAQSDHKFFEKSGYLFFSLNPVKFVFDVGNIGYGKLAAHGHADALQILLSINKEPFLIDSGTYQYHSRLNGWRNYFRGTLSHNTISVNWMDQAKSGGRMIWNIQPDVYVENFEINDKFISCTAWHNGFMKQGVNVKHSRNVTYDQVLKNYLIVDTLESAEPFECIFSLHFAPHLKIKQEENSIYLIGKGATVVLKNDHFKSAKLFYGETLNLAGWYSPSFNVLHPTTTLRLILRNTTNIILKTEITPILSNQDNES